MINSRSNLETATLAGGCFWCTEAIFKKLKGVESVNPGYSGGDPPRQLAGSGEKPTYQQVSGGETGHAESVQIKFDPKVISYEKLLEVFFKLHDPTTKNRQGNDIGSQYRSVIFYHNNEQKELAQKMIDKLNKEVYDQRIVTELSAHKNFFEAEDYHKDYYEKNRTAGYCRVIIDPKIHKLYKEFGELTKNPD